MKAVQRRASAILSRLNGGPIIGAEVGVFHGRLSALLLARTDLTLHMVDSWLPSSAQPKRYKDSGDLVAKLGPNEMQFAKSEAHASTDFARARRQVFQGDSVEVAADRLDAFYDFVFIDADHSYEGVARDLAAWFPKVKSGALLCGHDYGNANFPGVRVAVDEFCTMHRFQIDKGLDNTWFVRLP